MIVDLYFFKSSWSQPEWDRNRVALKERFILFTLFDLHFSSPKSSSKRKRDSEGEHIDSHSSAARKIKDKFRSDISGVIVRHLKPYFSDTCEIGRITSHDDFKHLARKVIFGLLTMSELKCNSFVLWRA